MRHSNAKKVTNTTKRVTNNIQKCNFELRHIQPIGFAQNRAFKEYEKGQHLTLHGYAGSGKTLISMYLALDSIENNEYTKLIIVRSAVPVRDQGFLPGNLEEKAAVLETPYQAICNDLYHRDDAYITLKNRGTIEFLTTSYIRGITINDAIIFIDEASSCNEHEISSILTRCGDNCRIIVSGDYRQSDLEKDFEKQGFIKALKRLKKMKEVSFVEFGIEDICRSEFVKSWILSEFD